MSSQKAYASDLNYRRYINTFAFRIYFPKKAVYEHYLFIHFYLLCALIRLNLNKNNEYNF